ncbi:DUF3775 domain-containing protein [Poseidonocella sedimentorum]|uniref:DUF3775 domain-containing protein n=1 Tax=Poseidonocella sedimentorum TaxID=871652 RepID=A0A1I6DSE0_9RHOB|nr:DUF3775 domain-containing protein [Poseidonocella sedimentorum]SFR08248.1 Protein of unknown function [Poseidonocella sedimentorum]
MIEISTNKVVRVIFLAREYGPGSRQLSDYVSGLNEDEAANLVALLWIGRDSFDAAEWEEALANARQEATAPTEDYLAGIPELADHLEAGLDALGITVSEAEDHFRDG